MTISTDEMRRIATAKMPFDRIALMDSVCLLQHFLTQAADQLDVLRQEIESMRDEIMEAGER